MRRTCTASASDMPNSTRHLRKFWNMVVDDPQSITIVGSARSQHSTQLPSLVTRATREPAYLPRRSATMGDAPTSAPALVPRCARQPRSLVEQQRHYCNANNRGEYTAVLRAAVARRAREFLARHRLADGVGDHAPVAAASSAHDSLDDERREVHAVPNQLHRGQWHACVPAQVVVATAAAVVRCTLHMHAHTLTHTRTHLQTHIHSHARHTPATRPRPPPHKHTRANGPTDGRTPTRMHR